jgi:predicted phosphoadenosine phosphosulfate sulfurtransferase
MAEHLTLPTEALPKPSPELILLGAMTQAFLRQLPKKRRAEFLRDVTKTLEWYAANSTVVSIRPKSEAAALDEAKAQASRWWTHILGIIVARMD